MPTYERCDKSVAKMAADLMGQFKDHLPLIQADVKIDFIFAFPDYNDETGEPKNDAIKHRGHKALGLCRVIKLKDRAKGMGDVEILLDGEWWKSADEKSKQALLDHEMYHICVQTKVGAVLLDDLNRPKIKMRKHDVEVGWFNEVAARHGTFSQERIQARAIYDEVGQFYWPDLGKALAA